MALIASGTVCGAHRALWERVAAHPFENDGIALDFTRRLARTLGWPLDETRALVEEYRRFCFLAVVGDIGAVTPSEEVDEVWHLHLAYTRDYWDRWCGEALGRRLHHDPTAGGPAEQARYRAQYAATLALYERWFGPPPPAFWPGTARRFAAKPRFRLVDRHRRSLPRLRRWTGAAALGAAVVLASTPARGAPFLPDWDWAAINPFDLGGEAFLALYSALMIGTAMVTWLLRDMARTTDRRPDLRDLGDVEIGYLVGGSKRAADTLYIALALHGAASFGSSGITIVGPMHGLPPQFEAYRAALVGTHSHGRFLSIVASSEAYGAMLERLRTRKVLLDRGRRRRLSLATWLPAGLLLLFGFAKVVVGVSRGKPVGFLCLAMLATSIAVVAMRRRERFLTREAIVSLEALRQKRSRALRAPLPEEVAFAFAMRGDIALEGTAHAAYLQPLRGQRGGQGSGGCGSTVAFGGESAGGSHGGSGCGGGDGGGGGGCGGCGGCSS